MRTNRYIYSQLIFRKCAATIRGGKNSVFSEQCWVAACKRRWLRLAFHLTPFIRCKWAPFRAWPGVDTPLHPVLVLWAPASPGQPSGMDRWSCAPTLHRGSAGIISAWQGEGWGGEQRGNIVTTVTTISQALTVCQTLCASLRVTQSPRPAAP